MHWRFLGGLTLAFGVVVTAAHASMLVQPMSLDEVTADAKDVVHAVVTSVVSERDENGVPSTWTTFAVAETLKGAQESTFTIKQYGVATPLADGTLTRVAGMPIYEGGEEVVLFLRGASRRGFTSPVGLGQGIYRVQRHGHGTPQVRGDADTRGPQDLDAFVAKVRAAHAREAK